MHAGEATGAEPLRHLVGGGVGRQLDRKGQDQARVLRQRRTAALQFSVNGLRCVVLNRLSGLAVKQLSSSGDEQLQVVVQLGHGAHGGARAAHGVGLVDRNRGRHAIHFVDGRTVHAVQELSGVGAERLHIATLAFGIQGVKDQAGFA